MTSVELSRECNQVLRQHAKSFRIASLFLPKSMRNDASLAYAFCRLVDDTVDEAPCAELARDELARLEDMVRGNSEPSELVTAYVEMCSRRGIGLKPAYDLIAGARTDLGDVHIVADDEFFLYCYQVAGTVGLMMCGVMGVVDERAKQHAVDLGVAMQVTNICRDVKEDAERGRVYLPRNRLWRHGVRQDAVELFSSLSHKEQEELSEGVAKVVTELLSRADELYRSGERGMAFIPGRARLAIMVASALYREIGVWLLRTKNGNTLLGRTIVPGWRKLTLTCSAIFNYLTPFRRERTEIQELSIRG